MIPKEMADALCELAQNVNGDNGLRMINPSGSPAETIQ